MLVLIQATKGKKQDNKLPIDILSNVISSKPENSILEDHHSHNKNILKTSDKLKKKLQKDILVDFEDNDFDIDNNSNFDDSHNKTILKTIGKSDENDYLTLEENYDKKDDILTNENFKFQDPWNKFRCTIENKLDEFVSRLIENKYIDQNNKIKFTDQIKNYFFITNVSEYIHPHNSINFNNDLIKNYNNIYDQIIINYINNKLEHIDKLKIQDYFFECFSLYNSLEQHINKKDPLYIKYLNNKKQVIIYKNINQIKDQINIFIHELVKDNYIMQKDQQNIFDKLTYYVLNKIKDNEQIQKIISLDNIEKNINILINNDLIENYNNIYDQIIIRFIKRQFFTNNQLKDIDKLTIQNYFFECFSLYDVFVQNQNDSIYIKYSNNQQELIIYKSSKEKINIFINKLIQDNYIMQEDQQNIFNQLTYYLLKKIKQKIISFDNIEKNINILINNDLIENYNNIYDQIIIRFIKRQFFTNNQLKDIDKLKIQNYFFECFSLYDVFVQNQNDSIYIKYSNNQQELIIYKSSKEKINIFINKLIQDNYIMQEDQQNICNQLTYYLLKKIKQKIISLDNIEKNINILINNDLIENYNNIYDQIIIRFIKRQFFTNNHIMQEDQQNICNQLKYYLLKKIKQKIISFDNIEKNINILINNDLIENYNNIYDQIIIRFIKRQFFTNNQLKDIDKLTIQNYFFECFSLYDVFVQNQNDSIYIKYSNNQQELIIYKSSKEKINIFINKLIQDNYIMQEDQQNICNQLTYYLLKKIKQKIISFDNIEKNINILINNDLIENYNNIYDQIIIRFIKRQFFTNNQLKDIDKLKIQNYFFECFSLYDVFVQNQNESIYIKYSNNQQELIIYKSSKEKINIFINKLIKDNYIKQQNQQNIIDELTVYLLNQIKDDEQIQGFVSFVDLKKINHMINIYLISNFDNICKFIIKLINNNQLKDIDKLKIQDYFFECFFFI